MRALASKARRPFPEWAPSHWPRACITEAPLPLSPGFYPGAQATANFTIRNARDACPTKLCLLVVNVVDVAAVVGFSDRVRIISCLSRQLTLVVG